MQDPLLPIAAIRAASASWSLFETVESGAGIGTGHEAGDGPQDAGGLGQQISIGLGHRAQIGPLLDHVGHQGGAPFEGFDQVGQGLVGAGQPGWPVGSG